MEGKYRPQRLRESLMAACGLFLFSGCLTPGAGTDKMELPPLAPASQVHSAWQNHIVVTNDVVHQGAPLPGLAGRVYLFGADEGNPVRGNGKVTVDLFDLGQRGTDGQPKMLQRWIFDKDNLSRLFRRDTIGWGYTLFLPWPDYQPEVQRVKIKVSYEPEKGNILYSPETLVSLRREDSPTIKVTNTTRPVGQPSGLPELQGKPGSLALSKLPKPGATPGVSNAEPVWKASPEPLTQLPKASAPSQVIAENPTAQPGPEMTTRYEEVVSSQLPAARP